MDAIAFKSLSVLSILYQDIYIINNIQYNYIYIYTHINNNNKNGICTHAKLDVPKIWMVGFLPFLS